MISRHVILLSLLVLKELLLSESANSEQHFLTLSAECGDDGKTTNLTLHTSEPFFGLLYSRDHPSTCKTVGEGLTATQLIIDEKKKCGLELMEKRQRNLLVAAASSDQVNVNFDTSEEGSFVGEIDDVHIKNENQIHSFLARKFKYLSLL